MKQRPVAVGRVAGAPSLAARTAVTHTGKTSHHIHSAPHDQPMHTTSPYPRPDPPGPKQLIPVPKQKGNAPAENRTRGSTMATLNFTTKPLAQIFTA